MTKVDEFSLEHENEDENFEPLAGITISLWQIVDFRYIDVELTATDNRVSSSVPGYARGVKEVCLDRKEV